MADIELVIKIDEKAYRRIQGLVSVDYFEHDICGYSMGRIANGTPLPKGHGKLKDIDKIVSDGISKGFCDWYDEMKYADTIIEADKEVDNDK